MKKISSLILVVGIGLLMSGCVSKMIGGAVDIVTLGIVKNDVKETKITDEKPTERG